MKKKLYLIVLLIVVFACEDSIAPEPIELINPESSLGITPFDPVEAARLQFENQMEWVSYIAARAIVTDADAKADFEDFIVDHGFMQGTSVRLKLRDLLAGSASEYGDFKDEFEELFYYYFNGGADYCDRITIGGSPRPIIPSGGACVGCPPVPQTTPYEDFIYFNVSLNCEEIYLPYGFVGTVNEVNSTAHPLNNEHFNDSYKHTVSCAEVGTMSPFNLYLLSNPMIVRPYESGVEGCQYPQYPFNFWEFLRFTVS